MKEIHTIDFRPKPFDTTIICNNYAIQGKRIFYLFDISEEPYPDGVFESEDLVQEIKEKNTYLKGPIQMRGSTKFFNVYRTGKFGA